MRKLETLGLLLLPLAATLATASYASADKLIAYLEGAGLAQGVTAYNCSLTDSGGMRAHIQAFASADTPSIVQTQFALQSGTSASVPIFTPPGIRHRVELQSHIFDQATEEETTISHCGGGWTTGWVSSGSTNVSQCSRSIRSSTNGRSGTCSLRSFTAASMGTNN